MNICCKTFCSEKGLHDKVAAYRKIDSRGMRLVLVGNDFQATAYSTRLKTVTRQAGSVLTGFVEGNPLQQLYSHARAFVLASYFECLSLSLLEAMAYELEIIASSIPANREVNLEADAFFPPEISTGWQPGCKRW